jgi:hypothetical protein
MEKQMPKKKEEQLTTSESYNNALDGFVNLLHQQYKIVKVEDHDAEVRALSDRQCCDILGALYGIVSWSRELGREDGRQEILEAFAKSIPAPAKDKFLDYIDPRVASALATPIR